ncbi:discs overgrown protein kinase-like [Artemia franciscana]|uniref:discs overgrown protein kinase-like n=1 Tax=Artemia franciscana TaxID=6661 RepID=UPI0032D9DDF5
MLLHYFECDSAVSGEEMKFLCLFLVVLATINFTCGQYQENPDESLYATQAATSEAEANELAEQIRVRRGGGGYGGGGGGCGVCVCGGGGYGH